MADTDEIDALLRELEQPSFGSAKTDETARGILEELEAVGDLRPAEKQELERLRAASPENQDAIGETDALYRGALQGATFQLADEIYGLFGGDKGAARSKNLEAEVAYPEQYRRGRTGGAITSGALSGVLTGPVGAGRTLLGTMGRGAALGGLEGAIWGSGGEEGYRDKALGAAKYGAFGGLVGGVAPAVVAGAMRGARFVGDMIGGAADIGNKSRAHRAIVESLKKSGRTLPQVSDDVARAAREGQPEYRLMDALGIAGQRRASGIARTGDEGAEKIVEFLRQRQMDQGDRMLNFVDDAFETKGTTAAKTRDALTAERGANADTAYSAARGDAGPVDVRGALSVIDDRIGGMQGSGVTGDGIDAKLAQFRSRLAARNPAKSQVGSTEIGSNSGAYTAVELSDFDRVLGVKQDVQDAIGAAVRAGRNNEARELGKLVRELDAALEAASPSYRAANDQFRQASRVIDSVDIGADMARRGRPEDTVSTFRNMTPDEQGAARVGYGDTISESIQRNKAQAPNAAREFNSTKRKTEADAMATDPALLNRRVGRENTMYDTYQRALGGSRTADNLQDIADVGPLADAARAGRDVMMGNPGSAIANTVSAVGQRLSGQNEGTRQIIARILMSQDPQADLARALRQEGMSQTRKRAIEGIVRALGREYAPL